MKEKWIRSTGHKNLYRSDCKRISCCVRESSIIDQEWIESLKLESEEWNRTWFFLHLHSRHSETWKEKWYQKWSNDLLRARARERVRKWNGEESNKFSYQSELSEWIYHNPELLPLFILESELTDHAIDEFRIVLCYLARPSHLVQRILASFSECVWLARTTKILVVSCLSPFALSSTCSSFLCLWEESP